MPTATKKREIRQAAPRVQLLPVDRLHPAAENGRKPVSERSLKSLARSIKKNGVMQPIVVRIHPTESDAWEIRAGYRRWRAAKLAGLEKIPAIVKKLDDASALNVTITENLQRENLHPLEEAAVIQRAFDRGYDVEAVAGQLGKTPQFVARRAALTRLVEVWRKEVLKPGSPASRFSPAHLELIARLPEETQLVLAEDGFFSVFGRGFPTVDELRRIIDTGLHSFAAMPWSIADETLDPQAGACTNCPKRSGAQPLLFDPSEVGENGKAAKADRCLDPLCFDRKLVAHVRRAEAEHRAVHPDLTLVQVGSDRMGPVSQEAFGESARRMYVPNFVRSSHPNAVPVMQIDGPKAGKLAYIDNDRTPVVDDGNGKRRKKSANGEPKPATLEERREKHQRRRMAFVVKQIEARLREMKVEDVAAALKSRKQTSDSEHDAPEVVPLLLAFGTTQRFDRPFHGEPWRTYDEIRWTAKAELAVNAVHDVIQIWTRRLIVHDNNQIDLQFGEARRVCRMLGMDFEAIEAAAVQALPQPKSWGLPPEEAPSRNLPAVPHTSEASTDPPTAGSRDVGAVTADDKGSARGKAARRKRPQRGKSRRSRKRVSGT